MKINQAGNFRYLAKHFKKAIVFLIIVVVSYLTYSSLKVRCGYLVWAPDAVLYTNSNYEKALKADFSKLSWGQWYYLEQNSEINEIYKNISRGKDSDEYLFVKVKIRYLNFIVPYWDLPTYIDDSRISKIHVFSVEIQGDW